MKKLIDKYKNMSPEMRMLFAAAGLGSFGTIVYTIDKWLFGGQRILGVPSMVFTALGIAVLMGFLYGSGKLVSKGFSFRSKKRGEKMMDDMSGDLGRGPVSMDAREAVKENNKKFFEEIREMRKQTKLNVYDLPWYIVIGDSGCGKTRLIEHSGLTFSRGRPEGYQLGTLNYNWWFTEDAIFIDMAGRLCNPQEDADHKEWQGFLNTVAKGRPACPINGAIVCISAEHLLEDTPEKIEGDANTMLERLRDLQGKLGVTFATYVVVTKCDKILGFMQFFDRAERDVEVRNQLVGWTRPAPFTDLFDPEGFQEEFEHLYQRLNELRVRRLNDDADEEELGMAYCLPEEFRELRDPLHTYLRVLFPPIKNPRAIKNLVARGVYFTSSLQQGSVILKHLKERMGAEAGENIKPLEELYGKAKQKPLFIKHLLIRKVFPEFGLVFRNANEVARNKRYSRLLYIWSGVLAAALFGLMIWGISGFGELIGLPRAHAKVAIAPIDKREGDLKEPARLTEELGKDVEHVTKGTGFRTWMAAPLVFNKSEPINKLRVIQAGVFQRDILPKILADAGAAFDKPLTAPQPYTLTSQPGHDADYLSYKNALLAYARWLRWGHEASSAGFKPAEEKDKLKAAASDLMTLIDWGTKSGATSQPADPKDAATKYMDFLANLDNRANMDEWPVHPAKSAVAMGALSDATIETALGHLTTYFNHYAALTEAHPDPVVREWMSRNEACRQFLKQYAEFLKLANRKDVASVAAFEKLKDEHFIGDASTLATLKKDFDIATAEWKLRNEGGALAAIVPFDEAISRVRNETWVAFSGELSEALGGGKQANDLRENLDKELWKKLGEAEMRVDPDQPYSADIYKKDFLAKVSDFVAASAAALITVKTPTEKEKKASPNAVPILDTTPSAAAVRRHLNEIEQGVRDISIGAGKAEALSPARWIERMIDLDNAPKAPQWTDITEHQDTWKPDTLVEVATRVAEWSRQAETTNLLATMADKLAAAAKDDWGVHSLLAEIHQSAGDAAGSGKSAAADSKSGRRRPLQFGKRDNADAPGEPKARAVWPGITPAVLHVNIDETVLFTADVQCNIQRIAQYQFAPASGMPPSTLCLEYLKTGLTKYFNKYVDYWSTQYKAAELESLRSLMSASSLADLQSKLTNGGADVTTELRKKLGDVLEHVCWSDQIRPVKSADAAFLAAAEAAVSDMMQELDQLWDAKWLDKSHQHFIKEATKGSDAEGGPEGIATALGDGWLKMVQNINKATIGPAAVAAVLSGDFREARARNGLGDEKLTEAILGLADRAAQLINAKLKDDLCAAQREFLAGYTPGEGWPYTSGGGVVDGPRFFKFLERVAQIEAEVGPKAVADSAFRQFFDDCRAWRDFLSLNNGQTAPLKFKITFEETPAGSEGVQNFYKAAFLKMGGERWQVPILQKDEGTFNHTAEWDWGGKQVGIELQLEGLLPVHAASGADNAPKVRIGSFTALEFCKFLKDNSERIPIPVSGVGNLGSKTKVVLFKITLTGKSLPGAIKPPC